MKRSLLAMFVLATTSCSAVLVRPLPPDYEPSQPPRCRGYLLPLLDTVVTAAAAALVVNGRRCDDNQCTARVVGDRAIPGGVLFGLSAIYGYTRASKCSDARRQHAAYEPFASFAARTLTGPTCQLAVDPTPGRAAVRGTVTRGADVTEVDAVFKGAPGGSWACDPVRSSARAATSGARRKACLVLADCVAAP